ncbi:protease modulator HflC [Acidaminobacter hydrogenoformans]|uniref:Protein HflC n=1 Tax=Acidaminobacter hydrogenoformans DSM 2784 TaxID=1120920 RepID=A0A1G5RWK8_9FIRM|nr:protease modulator HflC [Acidaminobacter hydrogenoformans]SCZ78248.1 membrane protease subunit HflC [Acidaminobacter hydrogenoformans DSM 2784]
MSKLEQVIQVIIDEFKKNMAANKAKRPASASGSDSPNPRPSGRKLSIGIPVVILLIIAVVFVQSNLFIVRANEFVIVRQFGEIVRVIDEPGLKFKVPFVQTFTRLPKFTLVYDVPPAEINTLDKKRIMVDYYSLWRITDPVQMIESLRTLDAAENRLGDIVYSSIRTELGKMNYVDIIKDRISTRGGIDSTVKGQVNDTLVRNMSGIELIDIKMKRADLPAANEESVFLRMISERESTAQQYLSQGDAEALKIRAETDREVSEILSRAEADAKTIQAEGEKEAARLYNDAYSADPEFFNLYRTLTSYKTTINGETVLLLPINSPYLRYLTGE